MTEEEYINVSNFAILNQVNSLLHKVSGQEDNKSFEFARGILADIRDECGRGFKIDENE